MKEQTSMNVWKESFPIEIRFLTRNDDLREVAGNWTWPETGPHTVVIVMTTNSPLASPSPLRAHFAVNFNCLAMDL